MKKAIWIITAVVLALGGVIAVSTAEEAMPGGVFEDAMNLVGIPCTGKGKGNAEITK